MLTDEDDELHESLVLCIVCIFLFAIVCIIFLRYDLFDYFLRVIFLLVAWTLKIILKPAAMKAKYQHESE